MIGLSLSLCINDIANGKVALGDVEKIISGTCADASQWDALLARYAELYWEDGPESRLRIARHLYREGKIKQPRLLDNSHYPMIGSGHWVNSEDQIVWSEAP